jgi:hypothetical protein
MVYKIPHRKQKIEQHRPHLQSGVSAYSQFLLYVAHVALINPFLIKGVLSAILSEKLRHVSCRIIILQGAVFAALYTLYKGVEDFYLGMLDLCSL